MAIEIREVSPDDAEELIAYVQALANEPGLDMPLQPDEFTMTVEQEREFLADATASENSTFIVAVADGRIVGACNLRGGSRRAMRHSGSMGISVAKGWRDQGIGNALMTRLVEWARETGIITRIELLVYCRNARAIHLYKKHGFEIEGTRRRAVFQEGQYLDGYTMALLL